MTTPPLSIALVALASVLGAAGQYLMKAGTGGEGEGFVAIFLNPTVLAGMGCYMAVMGLFTTAFRMGGTVRVLYPIYASTFIWSAVAAWLLYKDPIKPIHALGMVLLLVGIVCMSSGAAPTAQ